MMLGAFTKHVIEAMKHWNDVFNTRSLMFVMYLKYSCIGKMFLAVMHAFALLSASFSVGLRAHSHSMGGSCLVMLFY